MGFAYFSNPPLFKEVSLKFSQSSFVRVDVENGNGVSTFLKILAGLVSPTEGQYLINGHDVARMTFEDFLPLRLKIGYGFELGGLLNNKSIEENLLLPLVYHKRASLSDARKKAEEYIREFGLSKVAQERPAWITPSQKKAAILARSLIADPEILILDSPDEQSSGEAIEVLRRLVASHRQNRGLTQVIYSSNHRDVFSSEKTEVIVLKDQHICKRSEGVLSKESA